MSKQVLTAAALALLMGVSTFTLDTAVAQNGGEARSNDREIQKKLDDRELTPIRPIRRVGEENWPTAKDQPANGASRETSGQAAQTETKKEEPAKQETVKQDAAKQEPVKQDSAKQDSAKQEPAKQDAAKQDAAKSEQKQDTAKQETPTPDAKPDVKPQDSAQNKAPDKTTDKGFASIRLGTDEAGRVAVNEAQERQITSALRKHRVDTVNVKVSIGSVAPANARQVAVSSDIVEVLPQFRGYNYFATREEIVIVQPSTRKVVAMIPLKLTATASRPDEERNTQTEARRTETPRTDTQRNDTQRNDTRTTAKTAVRERNTTVGRNDGIPTREEILAAPIARGPAGTTVTRSSRSYQYYEPYDDDVVIIERRRPRFYRMW
jgi:hypothetical protein